MWTTETIVAILREAGAEHGYWTQDQWIQARRKPTVVTVKCVCGSWSAAWNAAGYPPMRRRRWTRQAVLNTLARVGQERGQWLTMKEWRAGGFQPSVQTVRHHFGRWRTAWEAAGFTLPNHRFVRQGTWTRDRVLHTIRQHARPDGTIMNTEDWYHEKLQPTLDTIIRICGPYAQTVQTLGLVVVSDYEWRRRARQADWHRAFHVLTEQLGHRPSRREWDTWADRPIDSRRIPDSALPFERTRGRLYDILRTLDLRRIADPTEREWARRYIAGETLEAIGRDAGVTRERIRQRLQRAIRAYIR